MVSKFHLTSDFNGECDDDLEFSVQVSNGFHFTCLWHVSDAFETTWEQLKRALHRCHGHSGQTNITCH